MSGVDVWKEASQGHVVQNQGTAYAKTGPKVTWQVCSSVKTQSDRVREEETEGLR